MTILAELAATRAWRSAEDSFRDLLDVFTRIPFEVVSTAPCLHLDPFVAEIPLTARDVELWLSIVIGPKAMRDIAFELLGPVEGELEMAESLILETCNVLMGAFGTALSAEGHGRTLGLPVRVPLHFSNQRFEHAPLRWSAVYGSPLGHLELRLRAEPFELERCSRSTAPSSDSAHY